jgi:hypothetical protein
MVVREYADARERVAIEFRVFIGGSTRDSKEFLSVEDQRDTIRIHSKKKPTERAKNRSLSRC